ncbi:uncharacterized protein LOC123296608 [Chrysoperla carnea]|uniref:uncharacterized protein LOC123296608 n=1 Tax=Chrysoperla carnea TaxID=189513 RepID=UPI001D09058B|nr:uncharacterized protein LOC123296608 [Chrysoperla carnea]
MLRYILILNLIYYITKCKCQNVPAAKFNVNDDKVDPLDTCTDPATNQTYKLGDRWKSEIPNVCALLSCSKININEYPEYNFPFIVQYKCVDPKPPDNDNRGCHMIRPHANKLYPQCCKHMVCFRNDYYIVMYPIINEQDATKLGTYAHELKRFKRYNFLQRGVTNITKRELLFNFKDNPRKKLKFYKNEGS